MKYLLVALVAPGGIYGSRFIGSFLPGHTLVACGLALLFMLILLVTVTAVLLNARSRRPPVPPYIIDMRHGKMIELPVGDFMKDPANKARATAVPPISAAFRLQHEQRRSRGL